MSSFHEPVDHIALSESQLEALNETNMEPSPRRGHEILCVKFESLLQSQNSSTPASFREMVATWKDKNKSANITGEICLRNPFEENYFISQTIEGPVETVRKLWNRIKEDSRVLEIISSTFALKKERTYKTWALSLGSDGSDKDRGKN
ncbi:hypothetical protein TrVE_jg182 [Triparma verrucosa]|uniref:BLUF domain-containing protein n=1 Tax=Triparma verrucosa TaxID=1606542 RepID=A0A9W7EI96_9STRA|nr:hypothetical protein TrVE_jg182 [Triparma verrucosa]